jgi:hypothetical protein
MHKQTPVFRELVLFVVVATLLVGPAIAAEGPDELTVDSSLIPQQLVARAMSLRDRAIKDNLSVDIVESLTTEVGPRRTGTESDKRAVAWSLAKFKELGFDKVWTEPVPLDRTWIRGEARAEIVAPFPHDIVMTALGYSVGTNGDLIGEIVKFPTFADLLAVPEGDSLKGKIAFVSFSMADYDPDPGEPVWKGYSEGTKARSNGHVEAAKRGAEAIIIRSVGIDNNRNAHTGSGYKYVDGVRKIPAAAISAPDAMLIQNMMQRGKPVVLKMNLTAEITGPGMSANIIGEITGREDPESFVVMGAHVDSWDEGTGAIDDGAGVGAVMAAAAFIGQLEERPRRSIRVLLFGAEEIGLYGAKAYVERHKDDIGQHLLGAEIDGGTGRAIRLTSGVGPTTLPIVREMHKLIAPLGVEWSDANNAKGQSDMSQLGKAGMPALNFQQEPRGYFMYHHTPNDTFDKIIPEDLRLITAAYATTFYLAAEMDIDFRK